MIMLLAALHEMRAIRAKQEAIAYIQAQHWFDVQPEDWNPYPSQTEPRWHTLIAWARKDCVLRDYMFDHDENDHWEITRKGLDRFDVLRAAFATGKRDVRKCFLWSRIFKKWICPAYDPSDKDAKRPIDGLDGLLI